MQHTSTAFRLRTARLQLLRAGHADAFGHVTGVSGLAIDVSGLNPLLVVGDRVRLQGRTGTPTLAEIVGFAAGRARAMPMGALDGIGPGAKATISLSSNGASAGLAVTDGWLGRVIDPLGQPLDGRGALPQGCLRLVRAAPPPAATRARLGPRIGLGIRALDLFTTCRAGQRLGLFAGSGVGKSTMLAMLASQADCDVVVLALVGERGREVREFIDDDLGDALARSVVVSPPRTSRRSCGAKPPTPPWLSPSTSGTRAAPSSS